MSVFSVLTHTPRRDRPLAATTGVEDLSCLRTSSNSRPT